MEYQFCISCVLVNSRLSESFEVPRMFCVSSLVNFGNATETLSVNIKQDQTVKVKGIKDGNELEVKLFNWLTIKL